MVKIEVRSDSCYFHSILHVRADWDGEGKGERAVKDCSQEGRDIGPCVKRLVLQAGVYVQWRESVCLREGSVPKIRDWVTGKDQFWE